MPERRSKNLKIECEDIYIAVVGAPGAGKSTFISHCTESEIEMSHDLDYCSRVVRTYPVTQFDEKTVWLVDMPGFEDPYESHTDVLREVATWLASSYRDGVKLHGIIYLHPITHRLLGDIVKPNLLMFQKICGHDALRNVILTTTMWELVTAEQGERSEAELKKRPEFWGGMISKGCTVLRHQNTRDSALRLVEYFLKRPFGEATIILDLQKEMVDQGCSLDQTGAGQAMDGMLKKKQDSYQGHLERLQKDVEQARSSDDLATTRMLEYNKREVEEDVADVVRRRNDLKVDLKRLWEDKLAKLEAAHSSQLVGAESIRNGRESQHELTLQEIQQDFEEMQIWSQYLGAERPSPAVMGQGPVNLSLFGDRYWFDAPLFDYGNPTADIPKRRYPFPNTNENYLVSWGEHKSWYIRYRVSYPGVYAHHSISSDNFQDIYPEAHRFLFAKYPNEDPICVSLATGGHYFVATTAKHVSHNLPRSVLDRLSAEPDRYQSIWLGEGETFVSQRPVDTSGQPTNRDGSYYEEEYYLGTGYPALEDAITAKEVSIKKALALNPLDSRQYAVLWLDGSARYGPGLTELNASVFKMWCTNNFGTCWENSNSTVGEPMDLLPGDGESVMSGPRVPSLLYLS